jgi:hypothetical protein
LTWAADIKQSLLQIIETTIAETKKNQQELLNEFIAKNFLIMVIVIQLAVI